MIATAGTGLIRLIHLLEEEDNTVSGLALAILLQICTVNSGREALISACNVPRLLAPLLDCNVQHVQYGQSNVQYGQKSHLRAVLFASALCRQQEYWSMDMVDCTPYLTQSKSNPIENVLQRLILQDIVRTMKSPVNEHCNNLTLGDLNVLPINKECSLEMSKMAECVGARSIADFACHPDEEVMQLE